MDLLCLIFGIMIIFLNGILNINDIKYIIHICWANDYLAVVKENKGKENKWIINEIYNCMVCNNMTFKFWSWICVGSNLHSITYYVIELVTQRLQTLVLSFVNRDDYINPINFRGRKEKERDLLPPSSILTWQHTFHRGMCPVGKQTHYFWDTGWCSNQMSYTSNKFFMQFTWYNMYKVSM